jgi:prepilin-type N-terminal cleavage/methylation domain-containing protein
MSGKYRSDARQRGFTLIELSIVVAIAAVVLGVVLSLVNTQIENAKAANMRSRMETIKAALVMFVARNSRLPCPAIESFAPTHNDYGLEAPTPGTCTGATVAGTAVRGMLPFRTLGLPEEDGYDVYASRFTYVVTTAATNLNANNIAGATGTITLHSAEPPALGLQPIGNQINACSTTAGDNGCNSNAIAIVLSHGPNAMGAFQQSGQQTTLPSSALELENTNTDEMFVLARYSQNDPVFDDTMLVLTPDMLLASLIRDGAIRSARAVTNEQLQAVNDSVVASVLNNGGAVPSSIPATLDGWGTPMIYTPNVSAVCSTGTLDTAAAFSIRSYGPNRIDGASPGGTNDDITREQIAGPLKAYVAKITSTTCP